MALIKGSKPPFVVEYRGDLWLWRRRPIVNLEMVDRIDIRTPGSRGIRLGVVGNGN